MQTTKKVDSITVKWQYLTGYKWRCQKIASKLSLEHISKIISQAGKPRKIEPLRYISQNQPCDHGLD